MNVRELQTPEESIIIEFLPNQFECFYSRNSSESRRN